MSLINVISFNVLCSGKKDHFWTKRKPLVKAVLRAHDPDIFCLQEAHYRWMNAVCADFPDYGYAGVGRNNGKRLGEFAPIFYKKERFDLLRQETFWLSETPSTPSKGWDAACIRICTRAILRDKQSDETVAVMNTHLDHRGVVAVVKGMELIAARAAETDDLPTVLTGDFNAPPTAQTYAIALESGFLDTRTAAPDHDGTPTFHNFGDPNDKAFEQIIDYIFVKHCAAVRAFRVITDRPDGKMPSDHDPVFAQIEF